jgi:ribosome-associated heat shock protein Hsp15
MDVGDLGGVRIDRWLCAARVFRSRTQANEACARGRVLVNEEPAKASREVRVGDEVRAWPERGAVVLEVRALAEKRLSAAAARELYIDHSPPPPPREPRVAVRARGAGRPTKRDRRELERLRGR